MYGCLLDNWRRTIALARTMLAYATDSGEDTKYNSCDCEQWGIIVRDLSTGRVVHRLPTGPHRGKVAPPTLNYEDVGGGDLYVGVGPAEDVVVKSNGSVAWIAERYVRWREAFRSGHKEARSFELRVVDRDGQRLLASGAGLARALLALHGSRLEWTQDGVRSSALLR